MFSLVVQARYKWITGAKLESSIIPNFCPCFCGVPDGPVAASDGRAMFSFPRDQAVSLLIYHQGIAVATL
jgi:hypothetical protein